MDIKFLIKVIKLRIETIQKFSSKKHDDYITAHDAGELKSLLWVLNLIENK